MPENGPSERRISIPTPPVHRGANRLRASNDGRCGGKMNFRDCPVRERHHNILAASDEADDPDGETASPCASRPARNLPPICPLCTHCGH